MVRQVPLERERGEFTDRAEHRPVVPTFRFAFKQCPTVLHKLFGNKALCLLIFEFAHLCSQGGIFLLKVKYAIFHCFRLFLQEGGSFPQDGIDGDGREEVGNG